MMSEAKHTPGPWAIETVKLMSGFEERVLAADGRMVGTVSRSGIGSGPRGRAMFIPTDIDISNARLIAAAPDMLAALKLVDAFGLREATLIYGPTTSAKSLKVCRAAIAKAIGDNAKG